MRAGHRGEPGLVEQITHGDLLYSEKDAALSWGHGKRHFHLIAVKERTGVLPPGEALAIQALLTPIPARSDGNVAPPPQIMVAEVKLEPGRVRGADHVTEGYHRLLSEVFVHARLQDERLNVERNRRFLRIGPPTVRRCRTLG